MSNEKNRRRNPENLFGRKPKGSSKKRKSSWVKRIWIIEEM